MWPIGNYGTDKSGSNAGKSGISSTHSSALHGNSMIDGIDPNTIRLAANIRSIFGDNLSDNLLKSLGSNFDSAAQTNRRQDLLPQQSRLTDIENAAKTVNITAQQKQILDNIKNIDDDYEYHGPQRSTFRIVNPNDNPLFESTFLSADRNKESTQQKHSVPGFQSIEDEDDFLYGDSAKSHSNRLPPGIVNLDQRSSSAMSPISERLRVDDEWGRRPSPPKDISDWPINPSLPDDVRANETRSNLDKISERRRWLEKELQHQKRIERNAIRSPSFDRLLRNELERSKGKREFECEPLSPTNLLRNLSPPPKPSYFNERERYRSPPLSPRRRSPLSPRRRSPLSPNRRSTLSPHRRSPLSPNRRSTLSPNRRSTLSPHRRSPLSPRRRSPLMSPKRIRKRSRSISPRRRTSSPKHKYRRRSRSREISSSRSSISRSTRRRSRTPERKPRRSATPVKNPTMSSLSGAENYAVNPINPMGPIIQMRPHGIMPPYGASMGLMNPAMFYPRPYHPMMSQRPMPMMPFTTAANPTRIPTEPPRKLIEKKLINERDLLLAEREKFRANLSSFEKLLTRKTSEQNSIIARDGGKDSYIFKQVSKSIRDIKKGIEDTHVKLEKNAKQIQELDKSKHKSNDKGKVVATSKLENEKKSSDISKPKVTETKKSDSNDLSKSDENAKHDSDDDNENSRFLYFDGGVHWCQKCNLFFKTIVLYFEHLHSKDHSAKQNSSESTPWKEKRKSESKSKDKIITRTQLRVPCKGHQFIYPTHGFYCNLCKVFSVDISEAEEHFKSSKHNRSYTRYTLLHNNYEANWKCERDKAYTELMKREREEEMERSMKDREIRVEKRKKLEEELKRKEKEVKEKIELMNKNAKVVAELDGIGQNTSICKTKDSSIKSTKEIKLNLSSHKHRSRENSRSVDDKDTDKHSNKGSSRTKSRDSDGKNRGKSGGNSGTNTCDHVITSFNDIYKQVEGDLDMQMDFSLIEQELNRLKKEIQKEEFEVRQVVYNLIQMVVENVESGCGSGVSVIANANSHINNIVMNQVSTTDDNEDKNQEKLPEERCDKKLEETENNANIIIAQPMPIKLEDKEYDTKDDEYGDCTDELDGFDIIDSINDDDSNHIETIIISDDEK